LGVARNPRRGELLYERRAFSAKQAEHSHRQISSETSNVKGATPRTAIFDYIKVFSFSSGAFAPSLLHIMTQSKSFVILAVLVLPRFFISAPHLDAANQELQSLRAKVDTANEKLNGVYQDLLSAFDKQIKNGRKLDRPFAELHKKALIEAERAWIRWRDSEAVFQARFTGAVGGSALEEDVDTTLLNMIAQRTELLQKCLGKLNSDSESAATESTISANKPAETAQNGEIVVSSDIRSGAAKFNGRIESANDAPKEALFQQYGNLASTAFQKHPELVSSLKKLNPNFDLDPDGFGQYASRIATFNGRTLLILQGCFPKNCKGAQHMVAFEPSSNLVYLLQPTDVGPNAEPSGKFNLYGNPDSSVRAAMFSAYRPYLE
jgi:uncharacterized protein YecT (DUF1311 family)